MTDRELLELAAKASGLVVRWHSHGHYGPTMEIMEDESGGPPWNPLTDDGDALRLAVKLLIQVTPGTYMDHKANAYASAGAEAYEYTHSQQGMAAATRRAIVRAAAEIGKAM